jgi:hypothetical protein
MCSARWKALKNGNHYSNIKEFCKSEVIYQVIFSLHMSFCLHVLGNLTSVLDPIPLLSVFFNFLSPFALHTIILYYPRQPALTHPIYMTFPFLNIGLCSNFITYIIALKLIFFFCLTCLYISTFKVLNFLLVQILFFIVLNTQVSYRT